MNLFAQFLLALLVLFALLSYLLLLLLAGVLSAIELLYAHTINMTVRIQKKEEVFPSLPLRAFASHLRGASSSLRRGASYRRDVSPLRAFVSPHQLSKNRK